MMTLAQWKDVRRVDHLTLPAVSFRQGFYWAHPRFRDPANRPNLKWLDVLVAAYHAAQTDWDRISVLGTIIRQTVGFVAARAAGDRYDNAVNVIHNNAILDMNAIAGNPHQQAMEHWINNVARPARHVDINLMILTPVGAPPPVAVLATALAHIANANACAGYQNAQLSLANVNVNGYTQVTQHAGQSILLTNPPAPPADVGKINPDSSISGGRLIGYCNALNLPPHVVDVVYVPDFELAGVSGRTFRAGQPYCAPPITPNRPIVMINSAAPAGAGVTYPTTLAHEIGHAICSCGDHHAQANNLMADGNNRNGNNLLEIGQMAWMCCNDYAQ